MGKDPAVLFYTSDFMSGVVGLTMQERGQYISLLCIQHQQGHLSEKTICLSLGIASVSEIPDVMAKFTVDNCGKFYNERMDFEAEKRHKYVETRKENAKLGGRPKKENTEHKEMHTNNHMDIHMENHMGNEIEYVSEDIICTVDSNEEENEQGLVKSTSNGAIAENPRKSDDRFDSFWKAYPRKEGKSEARKKFEAIMKSKDAPTIEKLIASIEDHKRSYGWQKDNGQFIPQPARYLNAGMYDDEITEGFGSSKPTGEPKNGVTRITPEFFDTLKKGDKK